MEKKFISIDGNRQRLDGGAMFGNVPKALWSKWIEADANNSIDLACRCLLVQESNGRNILLETGVGNFFEPKLKQRYGIYEDSHQLLNNLKRQAGLTHRDIDVVILSHLHFDHAGGLLESWQDNEPYSLLFPNATYVISKLAWERALKPHARDRASFIPELIDLLNASRRLEIVDTHHSSLLGSDYEFSYSHGHTPGMLHTIVHNSDSSTIFAADLIPGIAWIHLPVTMGYDRYAELVINEKQLFLDDAIAKNFTVFYTHDPLIPFSKITKIKDKYTPILID